MEGLKGTWKGTWEGGLDREDHPRHAGALRTAILLGAVFEQHPNGEWYEATITGRYYNRLILAWLFIARRGVGIDEKGSPTTRFYRREHEGVVTHHRYGCDKNE